MPQPISIIIPNKNASHTLQLFQKNLEALFLLCTAEDRWEIVVVDFGLMDISMKTWLNMRNPPPQCKIQLVQVDRDLSRGDGITVGVRESIYPNLLILDTDVIIKTRTFFDDIETNVVKNKMAFFPIYYSYTNPEHTTGFRHDGEMGIYSIQREMFQPIRGDIENFNYFNKQQLAVRAFYSEDYVRQWQKGNVEKKGFPVVKIRQPTEKIEKTFGFPTVLVREEMLPVKNRGSAEAFLDRITNGTRATLFLRKR